MQFIVYDHDSGQGNHASMLEDLKLVKSCFVFSSLCNLANNVCLSLGLGASVCPNSGHLLASLLPLSNDRRRAVACRDPRAAVTWVTA